MAPWWLALKFVILAGVAEVLFACWVFSCSRILARKHAEAKGQGEDSALELRPVRWMSVGGTVLRYVFLIAINVVGVIHGVALVIPSFLLFIGLAMIHGQVRFGIEREIRRIEATQLDAFRMATRMLFITLGIYVVYYAVYVGMLRLIWMIPGAAAYTWFAIPVALFVALFVVYLGSPFMVRLMFPCKRVEDPEILERLTKCFERASLPVPSFWTLELDRHKAHNAMVSGLRSGKGFLKPALFFSRSLVRDLAPDEFEAVILHEVSHIALHHMRGRMVTGLLSVVLSLVPLVALLGLGPYLLNPPQYALAMMGCYVLAVFVQYSAMRWTVQLQELEADAHAVIRLGADPDAFGRGLSKIMRMNDQLDDSKDPTSYLQASSAHPTVVQRIEAVQQRMRRKQMGEDPFPPGEWFGRAMEDWGSPLASLTAVFMAAALYWYVSDGKQRGEFRRAAEMGDVAALEEALERGADINGMDLFEGGVTPLISAVRAGQTASIQFLLKNGADPNFTTPDKLTALGEAGTRDELKTILIANGAKPAAAPGAGRALASDPVRAK